MANMLFDLERLKVLVNTPLRPLHQFIRMYDQTHDSYHEFDFDQSICVTGDLCNLKEIALLSRRFPAPGMQSNKKPVESGQISLAHMGMSSRVDDVGNVKHLISSDGYSLINYTMADHMLYPGYIRRTVHQKGNTIYIRTTGEGIGNYAFLNETLARPVWHRVNADIVTNLRANALLRFYEPYHRPKSP